MIPGGAMVTKMQRTEAWFEGEHELYDFSIASECCHQWKRGRLLIKVGCH
jgi:hypothetical protein